MAEYIDRGIAIAKLHALEVIEPLSTITDASKLLADMPAADVISAVRGIWEGVDSSYWRWADYGAKVVNRITYRCSNCGRRIAVKSHYCPNCGAKMDGGISNEAD